MALACNGFTANTVKTTSCKIDNLRHCNQQEQDPGIEPMAFKYMLLDALSRISGVDIATITAKDMTAAIAAARCAVSEQSYHPELSDDNFFGIALYLVNAKLCAG